MCRAHGDLPAEMPTSSAHGSDARRRTWSEVTPSALDGWSITTAVYERIDPPLGEPGRDLVRIESEQISPLHVRDASLGDEPADVPHAHAKMIGDFVDIHQRGQAA